MSRTRLLLLLLAGVACGAPTPEDARAQVAALFKKTVRGSEGVRSGVLLVHSESRKLHWKFAQAGNSAADATAGDRVAFPAPDQPFHVASIGKLFTAVLILRLADEGRLALSDPIARYLPPQSLGGLFAPASEKGRGVTIAQLLQHRSGVADYFSDPARDSAPMQELILREPGRLWRPDDLVEFTRVRQAPVASPGERFHYSDTGYILLGQIIERVTGRPFHENLHARIFEPLGMLDSYLLFYSRPSNPRPLRMQPVIFRNTDVSSFRSLSVDWAGGGIVSTTEDLLRFLRALTTGRLVSAQTYAAMDGNSPFHSGIYYGTGLMRVNYGDMLFLMRGTPEFRGHSGVLGSFLFYAKDSDVFLVGTLNHSEHNETAYELMFRVHRIVAALPQ